jgi:hypothetical protein
MEVLIFDKNRVEACDLDDGYGGNVGLQNHLRYVNEESGSPDGDVDDLSNYDSAEEFFNVHLPENSVFADYWAGEELTVEEIEEYFEEL